MISRNKETVFTTYIKKIILEVLPRILLSTNNN